MVKITVEKIDVPTIIKTLINPTPPSSIDFGSLVKIRANNINRVNTIATCTKILFIFSLILDRKKQIRINTPNIVGINAVGEETSINPQTPIKIREIELMKLAVFGFITPL